MKHLIYGRERQEIPVWTADGSTLLGKQGKLVSE